MQEIKIDAQVFNDILAELRYIRKKIDDMEDKEIKPEYVNYIKNTEKKKGVVLETEKDYDKFMDEL